MRYFLAFSILTLLLLGFNPQAASISACIAIISFLSLIRINFRKKIKSLKGWTITTYEFTKPMDYLHKTYPNKNDAEILAIRETEIIKILKDACDAKFGKGAIYTDHFSVTVFYSFGTERELITTVKSKSKFGEEFLTLTSQKRIDKGDDFYEEDLEEEL